MSYLPQKLKRDAIVEALLEVRFTSAGVPEILFGRLADYGGWRAFEQQRLPAAEMPEFVRNSNPELRYQPTMMLSERTGNRSVKIGPNVISFHNVAPYMGWSAFQSTLGELVDHLFQSGVSVEVHRIGLRYINALTGPAHGIASLEDLALTVRIREQDLRQSIVLQYDWAVGKPTACIVRVASPDQVTGPLPIGCTAVVDVDVSSREPASFKSGEAAKLWIDQAHELEKGAFFEVLRAETVESLREI